MQLAKTFLRSASLALIPLPVHARFRIAWQRMWTFSMSWSLSVSGYVDGWSALLVPTKPCSASDPRRWSLARHCVVSE